MKRPVRLLALSLSSALLVVSGIIASHETAGAKSYTIAIVTKAETISVFQDVDAGAQVAASQLGDKFVHTGPSTPDAAKQRDIIVNNLIPTHPDAIGASANDPQVVGAAMAQAKQRGIKTFSWDSDVTPGSRSVFVNQAPVQDVGKLLARMACRDARGCRGQVAVLSATTTSTNQNAWIAAMRRALRVNRQYHNLHLVTIAYGNDDPAKSTTETQGLLRQYPNLKVIVAPTSVGIVAASRVVQTRGLRGKVDVTGLCFAKEMAQYLRNGVSKQCALWSFKDLGYLSFQVGHALAAGTIKGNVGETVNAGVLGRRIIQSGGVVILGPLQQYNRYNVNFYIQHSSKCCG
ncbi:MAG: rhamnose ABC transporter substrate-binding protein [Chloroflexota bacterium]